LKIAKLLHRLIKIDLFVRMEDTNETDSFVWEQTAKSVLIFATTVATNLSRSNPNGSVGSAKWWRKWKISICPRLRPILTWGMPSHW